MYLDVLTVIFRSDNLLKVVATLEMAILKEKKDEKISKVQT